MLNAQEYVTYALEGNTITEERLQAWDGVTDTKWTDVAFENSLMTKHNLAFQGGNDRGGYYLSLSSLNNDGIVKGNKDRYERLTATVNADYKIKDWLRVGTTNQIEKYSIQAVTESNDYGENEMNNLLLGVLQLDPLTPDVYNADNLPDYMQQLLNDGHTLLTNDAGQYYGISQFFTDGTNFHPMIIRDKTTQKNSGFNVNGSVFADLTPVKDLTITSRFGYRLSGARNSTYNHPYYGNVATFRNEAGLTSQNATTVYYQWENFVNYSKTIGLHTVSAMAGMSYQENSYDYVYGSLNGQNGEPGILKDDPLFAYLNYKSSTAIMNVEGEETKTSKLSYFGRLGYTFDNKYLLQASLRADAADLAYLPVNNRWGYFPAVSAGWIVSNEEFFKSPDNPVSFLKLRVSWGQNGSLAALGGYLYGTSITGGTLASVYPFTSSAFTPAYYPVSMGNDELKWETSEQTDIGFDLRFFRDRLTFGFDWFNKRTKDLLVSGTRPSLVVGGTVSPTNAGEVKNTGVEFELGWTDRIGDFSYGVRANLATLNNEVTYLDQSLTRIGGTRLNAMPISYFEQGYPVYYFRGYQLDHIDPANGEPVFKDLSGDGTINEEDQTYIGDAIPDLTYGITLTAAWKGFDLTVFGTGAQGNDIFYALGRTDRLKEIGYDGRWTPGNTNASKPRANADDMVRYLLSDAIVFDGSYFKIKQIQLGYSLPKSLLGKTFIDGIRIYASLDDFITFSSYPGFDPEAASSGLVPGGMGIDKGLYPTSKKVVCGVNITF
jgi:TonB-linked SusC/RagA family outer membrane protein